MCNYLLIPIVNTGIPSASPMGTSPNIPICISPTDFEYVNISLPTVLITLPTIKDYLTPIQSTTNPKINP